MITRIAEKNIFNITPTIVLLRSENPSG